MLIFAFKRLMIPSCKRLVSNSARMAAPVRALVPIANGSEDIESSSIIDVLRRAKFDVVVAAVGGVGDGNKSVTLARGMKITADINVEDACADGAAWDLIALPGGMPGAEHLRDSEVLVRTLQEQKHAGRWLAAMCASPAVVLVPHKLVDETSIATAHANFAARLPNQGPHVEKRVVVDAEQKLITSRGPGTAIEWALQCVACVAGRDAALAVAAPMHMHDDFELA